ncbi:cytochrome P450 [Fragilariopsis cylindrus CCMP1102]|uniref:Cytochrome P450 n=1 Tax=Fragilariopsis cylindrus CCMP1102 TaxID=635003 RepID=A0A1E7EYB4_9STRA|nr:cytochrome P450 [Fragilariopsis cylindrus CCMP1102]|eukprot:OEU10824.1 cytochrome P450 [Fragilariopsis cylindrus CCMP1102]
MVHTILQNEVAVWTFGIGFFTIAGYLFMLNTKVGKQKLDGPIMKRKFQNNTMSNTSFSSSTKILPRKGDRVRIDGLKGAAKEYNGKFGTVRDLISAKDRNYGIKLPDRSIEIAVRLSNHKGILGELLEPIMGKGLIPADPVTWRQRRPQIVPAFHRKWLEYMIGEFAYCNSPLIDSLNKIADTTGKVEMEEKFCSVALDIIGKTIFNYDFGSVTKESPVVKAVYSALVEVEHRSMTPAPYWDLPFANQLVPRLRKFNGDIELLNDALDKLILGAKKTRTEEDIETLESRNYAESDDPSMLRFLVDMRGADIDNKQLRDDLMTMLIAGHETETIIRGVTSTRTINRVNIYCCNINNIKLKKNNSNANENNKDYLNKVRASSTD